MKRAIAGLALSNGFGIEITEADDEHVAWRWSNDPAEHVSKVNSGAFRVGRTWYRLDMFERYQRYAKSMKEQEHDIRGTEQGPEDPAQAADPR